MSNTPQWPDQPFYVTTELDSSYVIAVEGDNTLTMKPLASAQDQQWKAVNIGILGQVVQHVPTGLYMSQSFRDDDVFGPVPDGNMNVQKLSPLEVAQLWDPEDTGDGFVYLTARMGKVQLLGNLDDAYLQLSAQYLGTPPANAPYTEWKVVAVPTS